jgi:hypothetical protein
MTLTHTDTRPTPRALSLPAALLRLEGAAVFLLVIAVFIQQGWSGWLFAGLFFAPDLSAIGYLINTTRGAQLYNLVHTYTLPLALLGGSLVADWSPGVQVALIWSAHIGVDRLVGYGLKYATAFKETHIQRV